ncbi:MAG TPA: DNA polymerase I [Gemmatimonadales bacterium]|nr:DNA polymerase I [Gemmatimonadales bacterium]
MSQSPPQRLFLVDGYALIYRAFFAMIARPLTTKSGENTSAAWGVTNFLLRLREKHHPDYLAWVLDRGESFRHREYPEYKATREKLGAELQQDFDRSLERIAELLAAFRVPVLAVDGYEADDVIGTLAPAGVAAGLASVIVSGDKDFYQLIAPGIALLNPGRGGPGAVEEQWVDESNAAERFGVLPQQIVDYFALVGDSSDNVPGVRGIGDKTAVELLKTYGTLDTILARTAEIPGKRAREALQAHAAEALLSRDLVTIRRNVPIALELDRLVVSAPDRDELERLFIELEFRTLIPKLDLPELSGATPVAAPAATAAPAAPPAAVITDVAGLERVVTACRQAPLVALDTVTTSPDALRGELVGLALAVGPGASWYLPFTHIPPEGLLAGEAAPANLPPLGSEPLAGIRALLGDRAVPKAGHNVKHDWLVLRRAGVPLAGLAYDSMLAAFVIDPGRRSFALDELARDRLGLRLKTRDDLTGRGKTQRPVSEIAIAEAARAGCDHAEAVLHLRAAFAPELEDHHLQPLLDTVELPLVGVLTDMEWAGVLVDRALLAELSRGFTAELVTIERQLYAAAGTDFNLNSTPQLRTLLFDKLQLPVLKKTKTGPSTDYDVLEELAGMGHEVPKLLIAYRELSKLKSTYVDALPDYIHPDTGRIHTSFNQVGAATGRLSSSDPNLQNIPVRTERGESIRRAFIAPPGFRLLVADYSQIELRLLAHFSEDPAFVRAFEQGGDIHRQTAAVIFGVPQDQVTAEMRAQAKTINFATIYGQGPVALARQLGITLEDAKAFIKQYFERFAGVRAWLDRTIAQARERGYVETLFARRRYIPELKDRNFNIRAFGERTATNSPLQGSAADLIKVAMIRIHAALPTDAPGTRMLLQVHDELVFEVPADQEIAAKELVKRDMEGAAKLRVPLVVSVGAGTNWVDAKG